MLIASGYLLIIIILNQVDWVIGKVLASLSVGRLMCGSPREIMTAHTEAALWERTLESLPGSFSPPCCWKHDTSHCLAEFTVSQNLKKNMILSILTEKNLSHPGFPPPPLNLMISTSIHFPEHDIHLLFFISLLFFNRDRCNPSANSSLKTEFQF